MSESGDSGPGRREVAHRLFAAEFDDADFSYSESDEERAPNYVVTPTGARVNRLFLVGVLTELEQVNDDVLRARVVDPTGPFVVYAGQYQPDELAFLEGADPPMFVAVTGKARTFQPDDSDRVFTSVRPESISEVDADTRDRWVVQAAEQTVSRIGRMASAKQAGLAGDELRLALLDQGIDESAAAGITLALDHYGTTGDYLDALRTTALDAARVVAGDTDEAEGLSLSPGDGTDDPIPLLASLDLDTDVSTPETTTEEAGADTAADEPGMESGAGEPATETAADEPVSETTETDTAADEPAVPETEPASEGDTTEPTIDEEPAVSETPSASEPEAVDSEADPEPSTAAPSASESEPSSGSGVDVSGETPDESEPDVDATEPEPTTSAVSDTDTATADTDADGDLGEFDPEFELDDDEREEIEQEYGTDFQTGTEVDEPGEAGMETPDPEDLAEAAEEGAPAAAADAEPAPDSAGAPAGDESPEPSADAATSDAPAETPETATDAGADETTAGESADEDAPAADVDLEDAVMEVMEDLDDGSGADREELLAAVVDRYGADPDAVEDAIQDALMGGRCYEPDDGKLTPI
jgi:RPA family protein